MSNKSKTGPTKKIKKEKHKKETAVVTSKTLHACDIDNALAAALRYETGPSRCIRINVINPTPPVTKFPGRGNVTNVEGNNFTSVGSNGTFINTFRVPDEAHLSQGQLFYKGKRVTKDDAALLAEFPVLLAVLNSIK